jgi:DNA-binding NarL/FixJ family response regulator
VSHLQNIRRRVQVVVQERTFADALAARLNGEEGVEVVAATCAEQLVTRPVGPTSADVLLLDADIPGGAAFALCQETSGHGGAPQVIMLSYSSEPQMVVAAIQAGAAAWVPKDETLDHLLRVIAGIGPGEIWLPPSITGRVMRLLLRDRAGPQDSDRLLAALTPREREILACLANGSKRHEVAAQLNLSENTVRTHVQNLMTKLRVHSALEAVAVTRLGLGLEPARPHELVSRHATSCLHHHRELDAVPHRARGPRTP